MKMQITKRVQVSFCYTILGLSLAGMQFAALYVVANPSAKTYTATITDKQVYDGDTIQDVRVKILSLKGNYSEQVLWPGVVIEGDSLYAETDIRIAGIDTPEKRPRKAGRTNASRTKEKAAAAKAREALISLISTQAYRIELSNPVSGKYAGRIVADVHVGDVRVADYMIEKGHAYAYNGRTKKKFDDWYTK